MRCYWKVVLGLVLMAGGLTLQAAGPLSGDTGLLEELRQVVNLCEERGLPTDTAKVRQAMAEALIRSVDPGAAILSEEEREQFESKLGGCRKQVGLRFAMMNGEPTITEILDAGLSDCGLSTGDVIAAVDDFSTADLYYTDVAAMLSCTSGPVPLTVRHPDGTVTDCAAQCITVQSPSVEVVEELPRGIGYIKVNGLFSDGVELASSLVSAATGRVAGLVLDLREAGGTNQAAVAAVASLFVEPQTVLFRVQTPAGEDLRTVQSEERTALRMPMMVLIDEHTRGAAELLAAVLSASGRGVMLIGRTSAGDPGIRDMVPLPVGGYAYMVSRRIVLGDGSVLDGTAGVEPHIVVAEEAEEMRTRTHQPLAADVSDEEKAAVRLRERVEGDPVLERAVDIILGLKALGIR